MNPNPHQERQFQVFETLLLGDRKAPTVEEAMDSGGDQQWGGKPMQRRRAGVVIVRVRAGRANGMHIAIDEPKQGKASCRTCHSTWPSQLRGDLGKNPERGNTDQNSAAEWQNPPRYLP